MQAEFKVNVKAYWNKSGEYEILDSSVDEEEMSQDESQDENGYYITQLVFQRPVFLYLV